MSSTKYFLKHESGGEDAGVNPVAVGAATVFTLYSRNYCHLCHDMLAELDAIRGALAFEVVVVDVDADPALEARYGELVPVLLHQARELARYRLDVPVLEAYLAEIRGSAA